MLVDFSFVFLFQSCFRTWRCFGVGLRFTTLISQSTVPELTIPLIFFWHLGLATHNFSNHHPSLRHTRNILINTQPNKHFFPIIQKPPLYFFASLPSFVFETPLVRSSPQVSNTPYRPRRANAVAISISNTASHLANLFPLSYYTRESVGVWSLGCIISRTAFFPHGSFLLLLFLSFSLDGSKNRLGKGDVWVVEGGCPQFAYLKPVVKNENQRSIFPSILIVFCTDAISKSDAHFSWRFPP